MKRSKQEPTAGEWIEISYDRDVKDLNFQLVRITPPKRNKLIGDDDAYYCIRIEDWTGEGKPLVTLHIKEALAIKSIIDNLVYDAHEDRAERLMDKRTDKSGKRTSQTKKKARVR